MSKLITLPILQHKGGKFGESEIPPPKEIPEPKIA